MKPIRAPPLLPLVPPSKSSEPGLDALRHKPNSFADAHGPPSDEVSPPRKGNGDVHPRKQVAWWIGRPGGRDCFPTAPANPEMKLGSISQVLFDQCLLMFSTVLKTGACETLPKLGPETRARNWGQPPFDGVVVWIAGAVDSKL